VGLGGCGDCRTGKRGSGDAAQRESGKLPHENILQLFAVIGRVKIYPPILNARLLRLRIDFGQVA
jgi:hypothetical protein